MDRYDFPYRPDMQPGMRKTGRKDDTEWCRPAVPDDAKLAVALFIVAVCVSFGLGARLGAVAQKNQSAEACLSR
jgi:hypothetical protein